MLHDRSLRKGRDRSLTIERDRVRTHVFAPMTRVIGSALTASPTLPIELNDDGQWFRFLDAH